MIYMARVPLRIYCYGAARLGGKKLSSTMLYAIDSWSDVYSTTVDDVATLYGGSRLCADMHPG